MGDASTGPDSHKTRVTDPGTVSSHKPTQNIAVESSHLIMLRASLGQTLKHEFNCDGLETDV